MDRVRIVVADDNTQLRDMIAEYLSQQNGMEIVGKASDGVETIRIIQEIEPDVLICDMIMPRMDGFGVLERVREMNLTKKIGVIALTALGRDDFIARAVNLGASYYMVKPFDFSILAQRIYEIAGETEMAQTLNRQFYKDKSEQGTESLDEHIANLFLMVGIPAHIKGYQYLREAVKMVIENPDLMGRITKELYPGIAHRFGTTSSKVERAIRHAIEVAWNRGRIEALDEAFGRNVCSLDDKPTNGEFIALVSDRLRIRESA